MERCGWCGKILEAGESYYVLVGILGYDGFCNKSCGDAWDDFERRNYPGYKPEREIPTPPKGEVKYRNLMGTKEIVPDIGGTSPPNSLIKIKTGQGEKDGVES